MASPYREPPRFLLCPRCGERARAETDALEQARLDGAHRAQLSDHRFEVLGEVGRLEEQVRRVRNELERLEAELEHARLELREINAKLGS